MTVHILIHVCICLCFNIYLPEGRCVPLPYNLSRHEEDDYATGAKSQVSVTLTVPSMAPRHRKRKSVSASNTDIDEETITLLLRIHEL